MRAWIAAFLIVTFAAAVSAQERDGATVFKDVCASCHTAGSDTPRAPTLDSLRLRSARAVLNAMLLQMGPMRIITTRLTNAERRAVAEYVSGKKLDSEPEGGALGSCGAPVPMSDPAKGPGWNGWGVTSANTRFQPADHAGLSADQVPHLTLKWAFGFPDTAQAWAQPAVAGGRLFVGSQSGAVYALDAKNGCRIWTYVATSGVRTGIVVGRARRPDGTPGYALYFSDMAGNTYAVRAEDGRQLWKQQVEPHRFVRLTGTPTLHGGLLYVPTASFEESMAPEVENCCTFRGSVVALNADTGKVVWRTYTIKEKPAQYGPAVKGKPNWGPSGAAIWSSPTIDSKRGVLYVATGNNYTPPATSGSDAVLAMDLKTGRIRWSKQLTENDVFNSLPSFRDQAPDFDFGSSPIFTKLPSGREVLIAPQKSGIGWALDPDKQGAVVWQYRAGEGGTNGGLQWGSAMDGRLAYFAVSDTNRPNPGGLHGVDVETGERLWYTPPAPPRCETVNRSCNSGQSAAVTAIPGVVFSGAIDGMMRAYSTRDGSVVWEYNTNQPFTTLNGVAATGGSINGAGATVAGGMVYVSSGYGSNGRPGNVLLAFGAE